MPVDNSTPLNPINAAVKYTDVERNSDSTGKAGDRIRQNVDAMMKALPFGVGTRPEDRLQQNPAVAEFDNTAAELPTDELIFNLAAGRANP